MPKKNQSKISQSNLAERLNEIGKPLKEQRILFNERSQINNSINELVNEFGDIKTNINLIDLLSPSLQTRAKGIPRPQNAFLLFRKNFSKGLVICNISMSVGSSSMFASKFWNSISAFEKKFWFELSFITKNIHRENYPNYKFIPKIFVAETVKDDQSKSKINEVIDLPESNNENKLEINEQSLNILNEYIDEQSKSKINEVLDLSESNNDNDASNNDMQLMELDEYAFDDVENIDLNSFQYNFDDLYLLPTFMNDDANYYDSFIDPRLYYLNM